MINLDKSRAGGSRSRPRTHDFCNVGIGEDNVDTSIGRALVHAVYAYSVRWLRLADDNTNQVLEMRQKFAAQKKELCENLWGQARKQMYTIMSRPSYRSILALYLFAIIPTSAQRPGDNISDLCLEASLSHQNYLSTRPQAPFSPEDSLMSLLNSESFSSAGNISQSKGLPLEVENEEHKSMTNVAYWFSIISDTTRALTRCRPSILLPGSTGEAKIWAAVRQRTRDFEQQYRSLKVYQWRTPFSDDQVITILQYAYAMKTLVWAAITRVQDALVHQISDTSLSEAVDAARKESNRFEEVFGQLICMCQRDFLLLNRTTQMCYSKSHRHPRPCSDGADIHIALLQIHFQVGNLILADTLPSTFVFIDENLNPYDLRLCACRTIIIALNLALQTTIPGANGSGMLNILLLDPYPDLLTNAIIRTGSSLFLLYKAQKLTPENVITMFSVVIAALEVLSNISHIASEAIPLLQQRLSASGIDQTTAFKHDVIHHAAVSVAAPLDHELFETEVIRELEHYAGNTLLSEQAVEQAGDDIGLDQCTDDFEQFDLDFVSQNWSFDVRLLETVLSTRC